MKKPLIGDNGPAPDRPVNLPPPPPRPGPAKCSAFAATTRGYTGKDRKMWLAGKQDGKFLIIVCEHPGNLLAGPTYKVIATFERESDRDFTISAFQDALKLSEQNQPTCPNRGGEKRP